MKNLENNHPGEVLKVEFMDPVGVSAESLAKETFIPQEKIDQIIKGNEGITADTALRFSRFFGTTVEFWLNYQADYDLEKLEYLRAEEYNRIKPLEAEYE